MNYRHAFHAGNFADVLKHAVLALCLERLNAKPGAWRYVDTHAGIGLYDLASDATQRSPEWKTGVARVLEHAAAAPPEVRQALAPWLEIVRRFNPEGTLATYPGSPQIALALARPSDQLRLCDLHPLDADTLRETMGRDARVKIERRDGYEALTAYLPPPERRGLVLVDPPFEEGPAHARTDFRRMLQAAVAALRRWPTGTYMFWRPLKHLDSAEAFDAELATRVIEDFGIPPEKLLVADLWVRPLGSEGPLAGAGVLVINPPYGMDKSLAALLPWLVRVLEAAPGEGGYRLSSARAWEP
jgi:23S rRNA (adenine2030-N6)-methyltransferase